MEIIVNDDFIIIPEEDQFTLYEKMITGNKKKDGTPTKNPGKERLSTIGYFSTLPSAVVKVVQIEMSRKKKTVSLRQYIDEFRDMLMRYNQILEL